MTNKVNDAVPVELRPHDWADLTVQLAASGWSVTAAAERLTRAVRKADRPGYIKGTIRQMLAEGPPAQQTLTPGSEPIRRTSMPDAGTVPVHAYERVNVCEHAGRVDPRTGKLHDHPACYIHYCSVCQLPEANRVHGVAR